MDDQGAKQLIEATQTAFELKMVERLRETERELVDKVRGVESKLQTLQQIAWAIAAVAVIFGVSGAWGWVLLNNVETKLESAKTELADADTRVNTLSSKVEGLEQTASRAFKLLQDDESEQLNHFQKDAKYAADQALTDFQAKLSSGAVLKELRAQSLTIVDADGRTLASLAAAPTEGMMITLGGHVSGGAVGSLTLYSYNSGKQKTIVNLGPSTDGGGGLWLSDTNGTLLRRQ